MVLLLPFEGKCIEPACRRREEIGGKKGDLITQDAEGTRFLPRMNDAVKCIISSDPTMTNCHLQ